MFTTPIGPPLAIIPAGYIAGRWREVDVDSMNTVAIYVFLPPLVFHSLVMVPFEGGTTLAIVAFPALISATALTVGRLAGETGGYLSGATLTAGFPTSGRLDSRL